MSNADGTDLKMLEQTSSHPNIVRAAIGSKFGKQKNAMPINNRILALFNQIFGCKT
jgi:hypothetical protein